MKVLNEFKEFALRGNVVDLAVGVVIGAGFGKIVSSLVNDVIMPPLGFITGGINFKDLKLTIIKSVEGGAGVTWNYGNFLQVSIEFVIIAFAVFLLVKLINLLKRNELKEQVKAPPASKQEILLTEIRDLLKK